ncbi:hypothetical protein ACI79J_10305 [Geodermatophilus sp. SYSU D01062]
MSGEVPRIERHEAADRAGKAALRAAHDLTEGLSSGEPDDDVPEPVVVRRGGPHRSVGGLADLIDSALEENEALQENEAVRENERESGEPGS